MPPYTIGTMATETQSPLARLCAERKVTIVCEDDGMGTMPGDTQPMRKWAVALRLRGRRLTTKFYQGTAHTKPPTAADVLACLISDASAGAQSFEGFCGEFGYDEDSRKALSVYKACKSMKPRIERFLGDAFEEFAGAEH